ncbi:MAG: DNA polymerase sliding clamp [Desulfurococcaceae archaeon]
MFKAIYPNASKMKYVTQAIAKITDEVPFYATTDSLEARILSPDKTMLTIFKIPSIAFEEFHVEGEEFFVVSSTELNKIVRRASRNDVLVLELDKENNVLKTIFRDRKIGVEREFQISIIPRPQETIPYLDIDLNVSVRMLSEDFKNIISDLKIVGEEALFIYDKNKLVISSIEQQKEYSCELVEGNPLLYIAASVEKARASYNIDMLAIAVKPASASKQVTISFDTDKPMKIEYELTGGGQIIYWLVPRI